MPLGCDRNHDRYWFFPAAAPGLYIEKGLSCICIEITRSFLLIEWLYGIVYSYKLIEYLHSFVITGGNLTQLLNITSVGILAAVTTYCSMFLGVFGNISNTLQIDVCTGTNDSC